MKIIKKGETGSKSTTAHENGIVTCIHQTVHPSIGKDARFQMTWDIDLANLTPEETAIAAAEHFLIKIRRTFNKVSKPVDKDWNNVAFDAKDYVTVRVSKTEKLARTLAQFSDEELAALGLTRAEPQDSD